MSKLLLPLPPQLAKTQATVQWQHEKRGSEAQSAEILQLISHIAQGESVSHLSRVLGHCPSPESCQQDSNTQFLAWAFTRTGNGSA